MRKKLENLEALENRENAQSEFLGLSPMVIYTVLVKSTAGSARSRAMMDIATAIAGSNGVLSNHNKPLAHVIESVTNFDDGILKPRAFQHAFVADYMKHGKSFPEESVRNIERVEHGNYKDTGDLLQKSVSIPGGISIALYPGDLPPKIETVAWRSKYAGDAFQFVTKEDVQNFRAPPYVKSIYNAKTRTVIGTTEKNEPIISDKGVNLWRAKKVLDNVNNRVILADVITRSLDAAHELIEKARIDLDKQLAREEQKALARMALKSTRLPVREVVLDRIERRGTFNKVEACDFLKRSARGSDSAVKNKDLAKFKKRARKALESGNCLKWHK